jgi:hypothetical protein
MPSRPSAKESKAFLAGQLARLGNHATCASVFEQNLAMHFENAHLTPADVQKDKEGYLQLARCAEEVGSYVLLYRIATLYAEAVPDEHQELVPRALIGLGRLDNAQRELTALMREHPKDANIHLTAAKAACRARDWTDCLRLADTRFAMCRIEAISISPFILRHNL